MSDHETHFRANDFRKSADRGVPAAPGRLPGGERPAPVIHEEKAASGFKVKLAEVTKPVYTALTAHQRTEDGWSLKALYEFLDSWWDILVQWAGLEIPRTALRLDQNLRRTCLGYFRPGHNEFGVRGEIAIAVPSVPQDGRIKLEALDLGELIGTALHEQLHLLQALYGKPSPHNHHNLEFRQKAGQLGLLVDYRGHQKYELDGPFLDLLRRHGVPLPRTVAISAQQAPKPSGSGKSTLEKWRCGCTNIWVGVAELRAVCLACDNPFVKA